MTFDPNDLSSYIVTKLPRFTKEDWIERELNETVKSFTDQNYNVEPDYIREQIQEEFRIFTNDTRNVY
jgi:hypothetical protein